MKTRMKKHLRKSLFVLSLLILLSLFAAFTVSATGFQQFHDGNAPRIVDNARLFSEEFKHSFLAKIKTVQDELQTDFVIVTTKDLEGKYIREYADDYYDYHGYGIGNKFSGTLMVIYIDPEGFSNNCWYTFTGDEINRFSGRTEEIAEKIQPYFKAKDFAGGVQAYLDYFAYHHHWYSRITFLKVLIALGIGVIAGLIRVGSMKKKMKTVVAAVSAKNYLAEGTYDLRNMNEVFVRSVVTKTARERSSSSGGGHHSGSSGVSHSGGGFSF